MDGQRFDDLTRVLATGTSRRGLLRGLTAGLGAALLGRSAVRAEEACPVPLDLDEPCAAKVGICHRTNAEKNPYRYIEVCESAAPAHAAHGDLVACPLPNQVIDPETCTCICDPTLACSGGQILNAATCECECPAGTELCGGSCVPMCPEGTARNPSTCQCEGGTRCCCSCAAPLHPEAGGCAACLPNRTPADAESCARSCASHPAQFQSSMLVCGPPGTTSAACSSSGGALCGACKFGPSGTCSFTQQCAGVCPAAVPGQPAPDCR